MCEINSKIDSNISVERKPYKVVIVWRNVILMGALHLASIYGIILFINECKYATTIYFYIIDICTGLGILVGAHRYWSHRSFKAKLPLQIILAIFQTLAFQNDIYEWARDHRVHHKHSETDADPHNSKRGFFFAHVGWLLCKKHPDIKEKGQAIDMADLDRDGIVQFQRKYYVPLLILIWGIIPAFIPYYFWNETLSSSLFICVFLRYTVVLNITWLVNSGAHMWGMRPYNKNIYPRQFVLKPLIRGEGFHNYHHTFPWDYETSEHGALVVYNPATVFINIFAKIGWAYDFKKVPATSVKKSIEFSGDSTYSKPNTVIEYIMGFLISNSYFIILLLAKLYKEIY